MTEQGQTKVRRKPEGKAKTIGLWTIATLGAVLFVFAGTMKFLGMMDEEFAAWGYSEGFALFIGTLEILGGIGLLIPRTSSWAAMGLMVLMIGAVITHFIHGEYLALLVPLAVMILLGVFVSGRGLEWRPAGRSPTPTKAT